MRQTLLVVRVFLLVINLESDLLVVEVYRIVLPGVLIYHIAELVLEVEEVASVVMVFG
jgi:hypothetical protein